MKKKIVLTILVVLVLAFTIGVAGAKPAKAASTTLVSDGWIPFSGSLPDAHASLNGWAHIVTRWKSVSPSQMQVDVNVNLDSDLVTVTTDTDILYIANGAGQSSVFLPPNPIFPTDPLRVVVPSFRLVLDQSLPPNPVLPPNPIRSYGFGLQFDLVFSAAGVLDFNASTVQVIELPDVGED
jgi:hypothetical protein